MGKMYLNANRSQKCSPISSAESEFRDEILPILNVIYELLKDLETGPVKKETFDELGRAWRTIEKASPMFGHDLIATQAKEIQRILNFCAYSRSIPRQETITLAHKVRTRIIQLL